MKEASGIQILGNLYNAPLESSAPDASKWSRPGSVHTKSELDRFHHLGSWANPGQRTALDLSDADYFLLHPSPAFAGCGPQVPATHRFDVPVLVLRT